MKLNYSIKCNYCGNLAVIFVFQTFDMDRGILLMYRFNILNIRMMKNGQQIEVCLKNITILILNANQTKRVTFQNSTKQTL